MSDIKRYEPCDEAGADEEVDGEYVLHEDYAREVGALRAELAEAKEAETHLLRGALEAETQLDAALAECEQLRAQCVLHEQGYEDELSRCNRALETVSALREALRWYAEDENYCCQQCDFSGRAIAALAALPGAM